MASEEILLELVPTASVGSADPTLAWRVVARYQFHNPTTSSVKLQMGFPETRCSEDCQGRGGEFRAISTTVAGKEVKQRVGEVSRRSEWGDALGRVFLYDASFLPGQKLEIVHRYVYDRSISVYGESLSYLTRTGMLWNGPIGRAVFVVRSPLRPWFVVAPESYRVVSRKETRSMIELRFEMLNFAPKEDLDLYFMTDWGPALEDFGLTDKCPRLGAEAGKPAFRGTEASTLKKCAALPLALHGAPLDTELDSFFYGPREAGSAVDSFLAAHEGTRPQLLRIRPNPTYRSSLLSQPERDYRAAALLAIAALRHSEHGAAAQVNDTPNEVDTARANAEPSGASKWFSDFPPSPLPSSTSRTTVQSELHASNQPPNLHPGCSLQQRNKSQGNGASIAALALLFSATMRRKERARQREERPKVWHSRLPASSCISRLPN